MGVNFWKDNEQEEWKKKQEKNKQKTKQKQSNFFRFAMNVDDRVDFTVPHNFYWHNRNNNNKKFGSIRFTSK